MQTHKVRNTVIKSTDKQDTHLHTFSQSHIYLDKHRLTATLTHRDRHTQKQSESHRHTHTHTYTHSLVYILYNVVRQTHRNTHTHTHTHTNTHSAVYIVYNVVSRASMKTKKVKMTSLNNLTLFVKSIHLDADRR